MTTAAATTAQRSRRGAGEAGGPAAQAFLLTLVAAAYYAAGKLGLALAIVSPSATAFWPPTGIALAAALLIGLRVWPAIYAGALLVNISTTAHLASSAIIAAGNTLEALLGAWLVGRFANGLAFPHEPTSFFRFCAVAALASASSATVGAVGLIMQGLEAWSDLGPIWSTWWIGDLTGAILFTPLLLLWAETTGRTSSVRLAEKVALAVATVVIGALVFGYGLLGFARHHLPISYLALPLLAWAAFRFSARDTSTVAAFLGLLALWATARGVGPFAHEGPAASLLMVQSFVAVAMVGGVPLAAAMQAERQTRAELEHARAELEARVAARTASLADAQRIAGVGNWEWDMKTNMLEWSDEIYRIFGLDVRSIQPTYETFLARVHPEDRAMVNQAVERAVQEGAEYALDHRILRPDNELRWVHEEGEVRYDAQGRPRSMIGTVQDTTERKRDERLRELRHAAMAALAQADSADAAARELLRTMCETLGWHLGEMWAPRDARLELVAEWHRADAPTLDAFAQASPSFRFARGEGLPGRVWDARAPEWVPDVVSDPDFPRAAIALRAGLHGAVAFPVLVGDDVRAIIVFFSTRVEEPDREFTEVVSMIGVQAGERIDKLRAQASLRHSEASLAEAQRIAHLGSWKWDVASGRMEWSAEVYRILGLDAVVPTSDAFLDRVHPEDRQEFERTLQHALREHAPFRLDHRIVRPSGEVRYVHGEAEPGRDGRSLAGVLHDITDRKAAEERFKILVEAAPDAMILVGQDGRIEFANRPAERLFGWSREDLLGKNIEILVPQRLHRAHVDHRARYSQQPIARPMGVGLELFARRKDGSEFPCEISLSPIPSAAGRPIVCAAIRDATERKRTEALLRAQANEKAVLLKEVHHRVKNNLQVLTSLLGLQAGLIRDPADVNLFRESQNRILSMALIHDEIYRSQDLASVDMGDYLRRLVRSLAVAWQAGDDRVQVGVDAENIRVGADEGIQLGLIVNELVSNSFKHAFPGDRSGRIWVQLRAAPEGGLRLVVGDDGVGLPPGLDFEGTSTLGLRLVGMANRQLGGRLEVRRDRGTEVEVFVASARKREEVGRDAGESSHR